VITALQPVRFSRLRYPLYGPRLSQVPGTKHIGAHGKCSYVVRANRRMASKRVERGEVRREPRFVRTP
jgi:hypothetical protein